MSSKTPAAGSTLLTEKTPTAGSATLQSSQEQNSRQPGVQSSETLRKENPRRTGTQLGTKLYLGTQVKQE